MKRTEIVKDSNKEGYIVMSLAEKADLVVLFLRKNAAALSRCLVVFFYYLIGIAYFQKAEGWDITDCIYFITGQFRNISLLILSWTRHDRTVDLYNYQ